MPRFSVQISRDVIESTIFTVDVCDADVAKTASFVALAASGGAVWCLGQEVLQNHPSPALHRLSQHNQIIADARGCQNGS